MDMEKNNIEKKALEEAAENLKQIDFTSENYRELIDLINKIKELKQKMPHQEEIQREDDFKPSPNIRTREELEKAKKEIEQINIVSIEEMNKDKTQEEKNPENFTEAEPVVFSKTPLPSFIIMTKSGLKVCENAKILNHEKETDIYIIENDGEKIKMPAKTLETIMSPEKAYQKKETYIEAEETPGIVKEETIIPEFAMITQDGLKTFTGMKLISHNKDEKSFTISNGTSTLSVSENTFKEMTSQERFENNFSEKTPEYEKLLKTQYDDFFKLRDNTAYNFRHNLSVYCRKEANSPLDALKIAKSIIEKMPKDEQIKTKKILEQIKKDDQSINQLIIGTYFEAIKEVPLNRDKLLENQNENRIAKPFYDTLSAKGNRIDENFDLKIGDTVKNLAFKVNKTFGHGKERIFENVQIISSSKEGNSILLMDKNKSYYEIPRDEFLKNYQKQQEKVRKEEQKYQKKHSLDIER